MKTKRVLAMKLEEMKQIYGGKTTETTPKSEPEPEVKKGKKVRFKPGSDLSSTVQ